MIAVSRRSLARTVVGILSSGTPASVAMKQLAAYLIEERRTSETSLVIRSINEILAEEGILHTEVVTARQLSRELLKQIETKLKKATHARSVQISEVVDEDIIGGVIIRTPLSELDASIVTKLKNLRTR